jgi:hypothetical protein
MTFTEAQTTAFFEGADQMALNERTRGRLAIEGLETVQDLVEFDDDSFKQLVDCVECEEPCKAQGGHEGCQVL